MNNKIIVGIVAVVLIAGGAFYGGMLYGQSSTLSSSAGGRFGSSAGSQRAARFAGGAAGGSGSMFITGDIIAAGPQSITLQLSNGSTTTPAAATGSKIVFLNSSTPIMKTAAGSLQDLNVGTHVVVTGATNPDGSIQAQDVQIRPMVFSGGAQ